MNQIVNLNAASTLTMSSIEIADLTKKRHDNVRADIEKMAKALSLSFQEKPVSSDGGRPSKAFLLPKQETMILVSGYSIELRARIIDRWMELEQQAQTITPYIPTTFVEALRLAADEAEKRLIAEQRVKALEGPAQVGIVVSKQRRFSLFSIFR